MWWLLIGCAQLPAATEVDGDRDGVVASIDCNDADPDSFPGAPEHCDGRDNDCDGEIDEAGAAGGGTFYVDADGDGFGDAETGRWACGPDAGEVYRAGDCDDDNEAVRPGAVEACNGRDDDCNGIADDEPLARWYLDADGDGYGDASTEQRTCSPGPEWVSSPDDCDDQDPDVNPDAEERCDAVDRNCDGDPTGNANDARVWYPDADGDGHGSDQAELRSCERPSTAWVLGASDCDDFDAEVFPGAREVCNGRDDDCSGLEEPDAWWTEQATARIRVEPGTPGLAIVDWQRGPAQLVVGICSRGLQTVPTAVLPSGSGDQLWVADSSDGGWIYLGDFAAPVWTQPPSTDGFRTQSLGPAGLFWIEEDGVGVGSRGAPQPGISALGLDQAVAEVDRVEQGTGLWEQTRWQGRDGALTVSLTTLSGQPWTRIELSSDAPDLPVRLWAPPYAVSEDGGVGSLGPVWATATLGSLGAVDDTLQMTLQQGRATLWLGLDATASAPAGLQLGEEEAW